MILVPANFRNKVSAPKLSIFGHGTPNGDSLLSFLFSTAGTPAEYNCICNGFQWIWLSRRNEETYWNEEYEYADQKIMGKDIYLKKVGWKLRILKK